MEKIKAAAIIICLSLLVIGCAATSTGTKVNVSDATQIEKGKTTEAEIIQMFGKPDRIALAGNGKTLYYEYVKESGSITPGGMLVSMLTLGIYTPVKGKTESSSLAVLIENDVVKDYAYSEGASKSKGNI